MFGFSRARKAKIIQEEVSRLNQQEGDKALSGSYMLYQEQIMKTLQCAGFTAPESLAAIKAISKKNADNILSLKEQFLSRINVIAGNADAAEKVWTIIEDAASYSFNATHAVCVALDSLYGAYLKADYH